MSIYEKHAEIEQMRRAFIAAQAKFDAAASVHKRELAAKQDAEKACTAAFDALIEAYKATSASGRALIRAGADPAPIIVQESALYLRMGTMLDIAKIIHAVAPSAQVLPDPAAN